MKKFIKTNVADIIVGDRMIYNSLRDFGLAIENTDYIGDPYRDDSNVVLVPGRPKPLDLNDGVFGGVVFQYRPIEIRFGKLEHPTDWDQEISRIRNIFDGRHVKLYFLTEQDWYWQGRAFIEDFERKRALGKFTFSIPYADPYKYRDHKYTLTSPGSIICPSSRMPVNPTITNDDPCRVSLNGGTPIYLGAGTHTLDSIGFTGCGLNELTFSGAANVEVTYTEGSL